MSVIYAVVVVYNPKLDEFLANIAAIKSQVSKVVLCNNSNFDIRLNDEQVIEFNFGENLGIAKAQSFGMHWAFENGADFILQMDQDSTPDKNMVEILHKVFLDLRDKGIKIGLLGPFDFDKRNHESLLNKAGSSNLTVEYVSATLSSGSLISKDTYELVGIMNDDLFIDVVDFEYCWRMKDHGFLVGRCPQAKLAHQLGEGNKKVFGLISIAVPSPIRHYYAFRNTIFLLGKKNAPLYWQITSVIKLILKFCCYRFLFKDGRDRHSFMLQGIVDGFKGKLGRIDSGK
jgi:rhamnosyltransferase